MRLGHRSPYALVSYFIQIQKLIKKSSFDRSLKADADRYDERIDGKILPKLNKKDSQVAQIASEIISVLEDLLIT